MLKWFRKRRQRLIQDTANAVVTSLENTSSWRHFLPPVVLDGCIYMVTTNGSVYRLSRDRVNEMDLIVEIIRR